LSIYKLLDQIISLVENSPSFFMSGLKMIRSRDLYDLIESLVSQLPDELNNSKKIVAEQEKIIQEAQQEKDLILKSSQEEANLIVRSSEEKARKIISESEIIKSIKQEISRIKKKVNEEIEEAYRVTDLKITKLEEESKERRLNILREAEEEAFNLKNGAVIYAQSVLDELDKITKGITTSISKGKNNLQELESKQSKSLLSLKKIKENVQQKRLSEPVDQVSGPKNSQIT